LEQHTNYISTINKHENQQDTHNLEGRIWKITVHMCTVISIKYMTLYVFLKQR